jgi:hypothetical protein
VGLVLGGEDGATIEPADEIVCATGFRHVQSLDHETISGIPISGDLDLAESPSLRKPVRGSQAA